MFSWHYRFLRRVIEKCPLATSVKEVFGSYVKMRLNSKKIGEVRDEGQFNCLDPFKSVAALGT